MPCCRVSNAVSPKQPAPGSPSIRRMPEATSASIACWSRRARSRAISRRHSRASERLSRAKVLRERLDLIADPTRHAAKLVGDRAHGLHADAGVLGGIADPIDLLSGLYRPLGGDVDTAGNLLGCRAL